MFNDNPFGIPHSAPVRFLAVTQDGIAVLYEHPVGIAQAVAETLRAAGMRVVWYSFESPVVVATAVRPTKSERRAARRLALV